MTVAFDPTWAGAICREMDPELWFPGAGGANGTAKTYCRRCPLIHACREYAIEHGIEHGIWGATSPPERDEIRRKREQRRNRCQAAAAARRAEVARLTDAGVDAEDIARKLGVTRGSVYRYRVQNKAAS
jgi:WhiB family redox-sensing transcriptional regulator